MLNKGEAKKILNLAEDWVKAKEKETIARETLRHINAEEQGAQWLDAFENFGKALDRADAARAHFVNFWHSVTERD